MPLYASAFFVPTSAGVPYILEDIYLRGGYRSVATIADRNAIKSAARKQGAICYVRENQTLYWLPDAVTAGEEAWKPFDVTRYVNFDWQSPLSLEVDAETGVHAVSIAAARTVPVILEEHEGFVLVATTNGPVWVKLDALPNRDAATAGMALILNAEKAPIWGAVQSLPPTEGVEPGSSLVLTAQGPAWGAAAAKERLAADHPIGTVVVAGTAEHEITLPSRTVMLLRVAVSHPDLTLELHSSSAYDDTNPFTFESSLLKLEDDGVTVLEGGTVVRNRRYGFFAAATVDKKMYIKVVNNGMDSADVVLSLTVLPME